MAARLPTPKDRYNTADEQQRNRLIELELNKRLERFVDIDTRTNRIIIVSPNGTQYALTVDDAGTLGTVAV